MTRAPIRYFAYVWLLATAVMAANESTPLQLGIHTTNYRAAVSLGARYIRLWDFNDLLRGQYVEPTTNRWVNHSAALKKMHAAGLTPVAVLYTRQPWRCAADGMPDLTLRDGRSPWMEYVSEVVRRHRDQVRYWEIWNEPDTGAFGGGRSAAEYVELARQAAVVLRELQAGIIIAGSCAEQDKPWLTDCLRAGLAEHCDILSIHYGYTGAPEVARQQAYIARVQELRALSGWPIWNTETSILRFITEGGGPNLPEDAALDRILRVNRQAGVEAVFYYYCGRGGEDNPESLLDWRGYLRPWAHVLRKYRRLR